MIIYTSRIVLRYLFVYTKTTIQISIFFFIFINSLVKKIVFEWHMTHLLSNNVTTWVNRKHTCYLLAICSVWHCFSKSSKSFFFYQQILYQLPDNVILLEMAYSRPVVTYASPLHIPPPYLIPMRGRGWKDWNPISFFFLKSYQVLIWLQVNLL